MRPEAERTRKILMDSVDKWREDRPEDMHVMPCYGQDHESSSSCPCHPDAKLVDGSKGRVWVHREDN